MRVNVQKTNLSDITLDLISDAAETLVANGARDIEKIEEMLIALAELGWIDGKQSIEDRKDYRVVYSLKGNYTEYLDELIVSTFGKKGSRVL